MPIARCITVLAAVAAACVGSPSPAAGSSVLWRNDWYASAPLSLNHQILSSLGEHSATVAFAPDRDVVLAAPSRHMVWSSSRDYQQIVRLRADGSVRWVNNFAGFGYDAKARAIHAAADGSAIVLLGNDSNAWTMVARLDAGGELAWRRYLPGDRILRISPTRLALAGCSRLSVLDEADGNVVWQRSFGTATCAGGLLQVDDEGNIYFASFDGSPSRYRVVKLDAAGHERWRRLVPNWQPVELAGVGSSVLYLSGRDALIAIRTSDGSEAWRAPAAKVVMGGTSELEPITITAQSVARLDPETGQPRWSTPLGHAWAASVVADSLLVSTYNTRKRIDLESGAMLWDVSDEGDPVSLIAFGDLQAGTVRAIGRPSSLDARGAPYLDYRIDFSNGQRVSQLPAAELDQGLDATNAVDASGNVVAFALSQQPGFGMSHLRRVDAASGATLWERTDLLDDFWYQGVVAVAGPGRKCLPLGQRENLLHILASDAVRAAHAVQARECRWRRALACR